MSCVAFSCSENISCLYVLTLRKTWSVPIYIKWRGEARREEEPNKTCDSGLSNGKLIMPQRPDRLSDGMSCQRPFRLSQAHTHSYVSQGSQQVLATDTENVRKQRGCTGDVTEGWGSSRNVSSTNKTTNSLLENGPRG